METEPSILVTKLILIFILTLINAFFSASEMAVVSVNKNRIRMLAEKGNKKAIQLYDLLEDPSSFLSTIQIGITFAGFFASASAATSLSSKLALFLSRFNIPKSDEIALFLITIILAYITLVLGELVPKRIALQKSESIALFAVAPIQLIAKFFHLFIKILSFSTSIILKILRFEDNSTEEKISKEEIKSIIESSSGSEIINKEMISGIFNFDNKSAKEVMTPRTDVFILNIDSPIDEMLTQIFEEKYSRIHVYENDIDKIIGILYIKDLMIESYKHGFDNVDIKKILHEPYFIPDTKNVNSLFEELQSSKKHMAVLIDEYGGFSGIITIEDLIEEIMGEIDDEYDVYDPDIHQISETVFRIRGLTSINEMNEALKLNLPTDISDTISGFLIFILGKFPTEEDNKDIVYESLLFHMTEIKERRIEEVILTINN